MSTKVMKIRDFKVDGVAQDGETILRIRRELEERLVDDMRAKGYVPVIDLLPQLYWEFRKDEGDFEYVIVVYGVYIGKKKAQQILGLLDSKEIYFQEESDEQEEEEEREEGETNG